MPFTQINTTNIQPNTVVDFATFSTLSGALAPKITTVNVANSAFTVLDDTAVNIGGGFIVITGANFAANATVLVDTAQASAVTRVSDTQLRVQLPSKSAATYNLYVVNPDGGTGIRVNGVTYSSDPTWVTSSPLSNRAANTAFNVTLSATGATSYAVANGSSLPAGTSLLSNGYFFGTVSIGVETTYSFVVRATDAELQDADKTFQVTVVIGPTEGLWLWGGNNYGQLGQNNTANRSSPTQIGTATDWNQFVSCLGVTLATKTGGTLWVWGNNTNGAALGLNDTANRSSPTQVGVATTWNLLATGFYTALATKTDGTLWTWGRNDNGQLGQNSLVYRSSPVQVGVATTWSQIASNGRTVLATKTDGTLWVWGRNNNGVHGTNTTLYRSSPTQVGTDTTWSKIAIDGNNAVATKTNGTLWSWGRGWEGSSGHNNVIEKSSPTQVGSGTDWNLVASGTYHTVATKTGGTLWTWGWNAAGQNGNNSSGISRSSPVQVGTDTTWSQISVRSTTNLAIKTDGTLWGWGNGQAGGLGLNDVANRSSPTQIGTQTRWNRIAMGNNTGFARLGPF